MTPAANERYTRFAAITTSNTVDLVTGPTDAIYVGGAGNIVGVLQDDSTITITGVLAGHRYPFRFKRINATSTTATNLVALYCQ